MRILVVDSQLGAVATVQQLDGAGHEVVAADAAGAWEHLRESAWDLVLVEWPSSDEVCVDDYVKSIRDTQTHAIAVLFLTSKVSGVNGDAAFRAGADDFVRKPAHGGELRGRIARALRCVKLARNAPDSGALARPSAGRFTDIESWRAFGDRTGVVLTDLTSIPFGVVRRPTNFEAGFAVEVPLVVVREATEMRVVIEVAEPSLAHLGAAMFGGTPMAPAALLDLLLEVGNTVAGAFAREARTDSVELTMGLPATLSVEDAGRRMTSMDAEQLVEVVSEDGSARLRVRLGCRSKRNVLVPVTKLREGMVIAADIKSPLGILVARAGTRMTSSQAERLQTLLGAANVVEVTDTAA